MAQAQSEQGEEDASTISELLALLRDKEQAMETFVVEQDLIVETELHGLQEKLRASEASLSSLQDKFVAEIKRHETEVEQLQRARMESDVEWKAVVSQMQSEAERVVQQM
eukprot:COSAG01_NODE_54784_length_329_cov_3.839130_1_plen_109_part_11